MNIKQQFGITHLLDIYAFIDYKAEIQYTSESFDALNKIRNYADILRTTKLSKELFIGDKAIFEGLRIDRLGGAIKVWVTSLTTLIFNTKGTVNSLNVCITLADLADLTKDSPIKLK